MKTIENTASTAPGTSNRGGSEFGFNLANRTVAENDIKHPSNNAGNRSHRSGRSDGND